MCKLKTEFCKMTIEKHMANRELAKRNERAIEYSEDVEDRCYYKATALYLIAVALLLLTASIAFGG